MTTELQTKRRPGRPTKYNPTIIRKTKEYINNYKEDGSVIPTLSSLAIYLNINEDTIQEWKKEEGKEEFSALCRRLKSIQKSTLINKGLVGDFIAPITTLLLGKHGYSKDADKGQGNQIVINISRDEVEVKHQGETIEVK